MFSFDSASKQPLISQPSDSISRSKSLIFIFIIFGILSITFVCFNGISQFSETSVGGQSAEDLIMHAEPEPDPQPGIFTAAAISAAASAAVHGLHSWTQRQGAQNVPTFQPTMSTLDNLGLNIHVRPPPKDLNPFTNRIEYVNQHGPYWPKPSQISRSNSDPGPIRDDSIDALLSHTNRPTPHPTSSIRTVDPGAKVMKPPHPTNNAPSDLDPSKRAKCDDPVKGFEVLQGSCAKVRSSFLRVNHEYVMTMMDSVEIPRVLDKNARCAGKECTSWDSQTCCKFRRQCYPWFRRDVKESGCPPGLVPNQFPFAFCRTNPCTILDTDICCIKPTGALYLRDNIFRSNFAKEEPRDDAAPILPHISIACNQFVWTNWDERKTSENGDIWIPLVNFMAEWGENKGWAREKTAWIKYQSKGQPPKYREFKEWQIDEFAHKYPHLRRDRSVSALNSPRGSSNPGTPSGSGSPQRVDSTSNLAGLSEPGPSYTVNIPGPSQAGPSSSRDPPF